MESFRAAMDRVEGALLEAACSSAPPVQAGLSAINKSFPNAGVELIRDGVFRRKAFGAAEKQMLEDGMREVALRLARDAAAAGAPVLEHRGSAGAPAPCLPRLLEITLALSQLVADGATGGSAEAAGAKAPAAVADSWRPVDPVTFIQLVESLMDVSTIADCQQVFAYFESKTPALKPPHVFKAVSNTVLRTCNHLVKRLSKAYDVQLCGRVLVFLANLFPLSERSGVNLTGAINTNLSTPIDSVAPGAVDSSGEPINADLYRSFWALQAVFRNPPTALQPAVWGQLQAGLATALAAFKQYPVTVPCTPPTSGDLASAATEPASQYLSSSRLFGLQLRDATFRRHVLVQALIVAHMLQRPGKLAESAASQAGGKPPLPTAAAAAAAAGQYKPPEGLDALVAQLYEALEATPENGRSFAVAVRQLLEREGWWVAWKAEACPALEKAPLAPLPKPPRAEEVLLLGSGSTAAAAAAAGGGAGAQPPAKRARRGAGGAAAAAAASRAAFEALLTAPADNMAGLANAERAADLRIPGTREFVDQVIVDLDPENAIEDEYRIKHDRVFVFRAMRLLARSSLEAVWQSKRDVEKAVAAIFPGDVKQPPPPQPPAAATAAAAGATANGSAGVKKEDADAAAAVATAAGGGDGVEEGAIVAAGEATTAAAAAAAAADDA